METTVFFLHRHEFVQDRDLCLARVKQMITVGDEVFANDFLNVTLAAELCKFFKLKPLALDGLFGTAVLPEVGKVGREHIRATM